MKKRFLSVLLAILMLGSFVACTPPTPTTENTEGETKNTTVEVTVPDTEPATDPSFDWSQWKPATGADVTELAISGTVDGEEDTGPVEFTYVYEANDPEFVAYDVECEGTTVTFPADKLRSLEMAKIFESGKANYQAHVQLPATNSREWLCMFIGLRTGKNQLGAHANPGIWLTLRKDGVGLRTGAWPGVTYMDIKEEGCDFSKGRMLYIEDDMDSDIITLSCDNDSGTRVTFAIVKLEDGYVNLYTPGEDSPSVSDKPASIPENGYFQFWAHNCHDVSVIKDFKATGVKQKKFTAKDANMMNSKDILSDTWVSADDEGRVSGYEAKPATDKKVGIFYFLWHNGDSSLAIYDHTKAFYEGGAKKLIEVLQSGPLGRAHYWAEPYFGYYQSNDEWVIRKHAMQLTSAGVDFVFFDVTNGLTYDQNYEAIFKVWSEMRAEGYDTPQIMFHCGLNDTNAKASLTQIWNNLYSVGRYEDLWFKYEGKPLVLIPNTLYADLPEEMQNFFTYRQSWADTKGTWYTATRGKNCWPWADMYPQRGGLSPEGELEQMVVMCGFWANGSYGTNAGRSYSKENGGQPAGKGLTDFSFSLVESTSGKGIAFEEQFEYAIKKDPGLIMLTGWNEWWAGRWEAGAAIGQTIANTYTVTDDNKWTRNYYVDCFNPEYSRDIEPVKGLFNDNYYYQMVQNIREYKGSRAPLAAFGQRPIDMAGVQSQWDIVGPEYRDYVGDTAHRDHMSFVGQLHYTNTTGRNDLATAKVSRYGNDVWFYIECAADITAPEGTNWMNLFINADCKQDTGWYGYDYVINRDRDGETCSVQKFADGKWEMTEIGRADYTVTGKYMVVKLDAEALGLGETFDFKWADNSVDEGDIMQFVDLGDTAPNDRFNYRYTTTETQHILPEALTSDMVVLKAGSYFAFVGGEMVRLDESTTKATFLGDEDHLYLPFAFAKSVGLAKDGDETYNHYGVAYVDITASLESCGKTVTLDENMLVLADKSLSDDELLILYRALY